MNNKKREILKKIIELTSDIDLRDNSVLGFDTNCGNIEDIINRAEEIIDENNFVLIESDNLI